MVPPVMGVDSERVQMNAAVSPESKAGWQAFADQHGLFVANVLDAIGRRLEAGLPVDLSDPAIVTEARAIMAANNRQRRNRA